MARQISITTAEVFRAVIITTYSDGKPASTLVEGPYSTERAAKGRISMHVNAHRYARLHIESVSGWIESSPVTWSPTTKTGT
ncbi:hypothetical protein TR51_25590 [Kitasatospora griseola]|uniref:Uncharacterized protein n=1 Tax=Kitasatospora griseola TaxID=2064 RepID=A0A0D0N2W6_KITGR|nr:hypothetical protein [Kitasatospora griseola]KIQ62415.1 hypothetical protein TR51_25590 [Kitasatospora griseola]